MVEDGIVVLQLDGVRFIGIIVYIYDSIMQNKLLCIDMLVEMLQDNGEFILKRKINEIIKI